MIDIYDTINQSKQTSSPKKQPYMNKQDYAKFMKEKRINLFNMANEQTMAVVSDPQSYLNFLNMQAKMNYTVTNTLLILKQCPEATLLKDFAHWQEIKGSIIKGSKGIEILEPSKEYVRNDGSIGTSYNPKTVFDVTHIINGERFIQPPIEYSANELVSAIIYKEEIKPEVVSKDSKLPEDVFFDEGSQIVFAKEGQEPINMINGLLREYAYVEYFQNNMSRNEASFIAESAGYILSKKYNLDGYDTRFINDCTNYFKGKDQYTTKQELESIKSISNRINERMEHGLYALQQVQQEKNMHKQEYSR